MSQENSEEIKVTDRRINFEEESPEAEAESVPGESQAKAMERKKAAEDYKKVASQEEGPMPKVDFITFVLSLSSSALMHLGEIPEQEGGETRVNLPMAKHTIDILSMVEEKTRGNLSTEEEKMLKDFLFEVRMKYVQKAT
ncbi:MAG: DUF1844 domain-containing protein [Desulfonatronovibrionaceae bacterium]